MKCPFCKSSKTHVVDTRWSEANEHRRRRYHCYECEKRFTTHERITTLTRIELLNHLGHNLTPKQIKEIKENG